MVYFVEFVVFPFERSYFIYMKKLILPINFYKIVRVQYYIQKEVKLNEIHVLEYIFKFAQNKVNLFASDCISFFEFWKIVRIEFCLTLNIWMPYDVQFVYHVKNVIKDCSTFGSPRMSNAKWF